MLLRILDLVMETNLTDPTRSHHVTKQVEKRVTIRQDVMKVKNFGTKLTNKHYIKEEVKSRFSSENVVVRFIKVYLYIFYSKI